MNTTTPGQEKVIELLLIAFPADGHLLMEGLPVVATVQTALPETMKK